MAASDEPRREGEQGGRSPEGHAPAPAHSPPDQDTAPLSPTEAHAEHAAPAARAPHHDPGAPATQAAGPAIAAPGPGALVPHQGQPTYGYPQQPPLYAAPVAVKTNGLAIASMVLGILWLWWIGSVLALVFGMIAKSQIDNSGGLQQGRGMAIAGIVLGWVGIGVLLVFVVGCGGCAALIPLSAGA